MNIDPGSATTQLRIVTTRPRADPEWRAGAARAALLLGLVALLPACSNRAAIDAAVAETEAFCAANPVSPLPAPLQADSLYIAPGGLTRSWHYWIPERLLRHGFSEIESAASIAPYVAGSGEFLRFRVAAANDPGCAGQAALLADLDPQSAATLTRHWADVGLGPDQCIAFERIAARRSPYWLEVWDASAKLRDPGLGVPVERIRRHFVAREAASGRVLHEHYSENGFINLGMPTPFGCLRKAEWDAFTDTLVQGSATSAPAPSAGPELIEDPPLPPTLRSAAVAETVLDLGSETIDGMLLHQRRNPNGGSIEGIEILIGRDANPNAINPAWPRHLQLVVDGRYRRVRLAWLEGMPHGVHDRPLRLFDLGERIGLLSITQHPTPERRDLVDLSWSEFSRSSGLPLLRADTTLDLGSDATRSVPSLVEDIERSADGIRFRLTEIGTQRTEGRGSDWVLRRQTDWFWPIPSQP